MNLALVSKTDIGSCRSTEKESDSIWGDYKSEKTDLLKVKLIILSCLATTGKQNFHAGMGREFHTGR